MRRTERVFDKNGCMGDARGSAGLGRKSLFRGTEHGCPRHVPVRCPAGSRVQEVEVGEVSAQHTGVHLQ